jgi:hypothetical protein
MGMYKAHQTGVIEVLMTPPELPKIPHNLFIPQISAELRAKITEKFANKSLQELHEFVQQIHL